MNTFDSQNTDESMSMKSDQTEQTDVGNHEQTDQQHMDITNDHSERIKSKKHNMVFLDWDDTMMPSRYIMKHSYLEIDHRSGRITKFELKEDKNVIQNLEKVGAATYKLLKKVLFYFEPSNIKIVTNGVNGWLLTSLSIAGNVCKIFKDIKHLLIKNKIELICARDYNVPQPFWKAKCFDLILSQKSLERDSLINVITIGDQWTDHESLRFSLFYQNRKQFISHHQIKLFENPDCRYMCVQLDYITDLIEKNVFTFKHDEGLFLEFDGYNDNDK